MRTKLQSRPLMVERVEIALPYDLKRRLFDAAAARGVSVSHLVREGITLASAQVTAKLEETV